MAGSWFNRNDLAGAFVNIQREQSYVRPYVNHGEILRSLEDVIQGPVVIEAVENHVSIAAGIGKMCRKCGIVERYGYWCFLA